MSILEKYPLDKSGISVRGESGWQTSNGGKKFEGEPPGGAEVAFGS